MMQSLESVGSVEHGATQRAPGRSSAGRLGPYHRVRPGSAGAAGSEQVATTENEPQVGFPTEKSAFWTYAMQGIFKFLSSL